MNVVNSGGNSGSSGNSYGTTSTMATTSTEPSAVGPAFSVFYMTTQKPVTRSNQKQMYIFRDCKTYSCNPDDFSHYTRSDVNLMHSIGHYGVPAEKSYTFLVEKPFTPMIYPCYKVMMWVYRGRPSNHNYDFTKIENYNE